MGDNYVVKMGRSLVKSIVGKSRRVVKKSIGKVFDSAALDRIVDRLLEKSKAVAVLDQRFSSSCRSILIHRSKYPSQKPQHYKEERVSKEEELRVEMGNEDVLIPAPKRRISSLDNAKPSSTLAEAIPPCTPEASKEEEEEDGGVWKERGEYSSLSEEEFKEMVEGFIERFNHQIAEEYNSANHQDCHQILFVRDPRQRCAAVY